MARFNGLYRRCPLGGGHDSTIGALYIYVKRGILTLRNATSALEKLIKDQANDMVWTEEELDRWALLEVRAEQKAIAKGHKQGLEQGLEQGLIQGLEQGRVEMALDMLADNEPVEKIVKYSHLPESKILELKASSAGDATK